jgi:hypothetical protein
LLAATPCADPAILYPLMQRLNGVQSVVADLRDLPAAALDTLPDGWLLGLGKMSFPHAARHPAVVALPDGCAAATVNRFLRELHGTECLSAAGIGPRGGPVDLPADTALRLFETDLPHPPVRNTAAVPLLLRLTREAPSCAPREPPAGGGPAGALEAVASLREALSDDDCRLELPQAADFRTVGFRLALAIEALNDRLPSGASVSGSSTRVLPDADERLAIGAALRMVPREMMSAPAAFALQDVLRRIQPSGPVPGRTPAPVAGLTWDELCRVDKLFETQRRIACPVRGSFRPNRPARDLVTVTRLQRWAWPDSAYAKGERIDDQRWARGKAARALYDAWDRRQGFHHALEAFATLRVPLPDADLLRRIGVLQAEAMAVASARRSRQVSFATPPSRDEGPS